jgi:hypothetical protein
MIATRYETAGASAGSGKSALGAADWLCLAAAPTFAIMAAGRRICPARPRKMRYG